MQDKKSFGKYIAEKRKEANLTQEELANKLYVIPTTISKWERGITYPDITVITNLCKELNISEHEFFTACDDEALNQEKKEIQKYRKIKKWIFNILNISYLFALITCFICNLVIDHTLSWFFIVLLGISISFTITSLSQYLNRNKYRFFKVSIVFTILVYMLLFAIDYINNGNWLFNGIKITTWILILLWFDVLIWTFTSIDKSYKISIILISFAILIAFTNPLCEKIFNVISKSDNIINIIISIILIAISFIISIKKLINYDEREK